jgi:hypothetical protein
MIKSWKTSLTWQFAKTGRSFLAKTKALARLQLLDVVARLDENASLASIGLHKLAQDREAVGDDDQRSLAPRLHLPRRRCLRRGNR